MKKILAVAVIIASLQAISVQPAEAFGGSGIDPDFCGVGYIKLDASRVQATGETVKHDGYTFREYKRSLPGGFGWGMGWTEQWNRCYHLIGHGPDYPSRKNFLGDSFSPLGG